MRHPRHAPTPACGQAQDKAGVARAGIEAGATATMDPGVRGDDVARAAIDATDSLLIRRLHGGFPLSEAPYAEVAQELALSEDEVLRRLRRLLEDGVLSRFGPLFQIERAGGQFVLAAMQVPEDRFDAVAEAVNALSEVAHNYRREHLFNMWFVLACASPAQAARACEDIEATTGLRVYPFPKEKEFFVELRLPI